MDTGTTSNASETGIFYISGFPIFIICPKLTYYLY